MGNVAVLVDAGYLFASCAELLYGARSVRRSAMLVDHDELMLLVLETIAMRAPRDDFLRIYWYDAAVSPDQLTEQQRQAAQQRNCKLRLGTLNSYNQQKGVDTLMVMDILGLSRNRSVTSLLIVSGDDDVRPAVEQAQEFGVRVHLVGVESRRGRNQAERLIRECDTAEEWSAADVRRFFAMVGENGTLLPVLEDATRENGPAPGAASAPPSFDDHLKAAIEHVLPLLTAPDLALILQQAQAETVSLPSHIDRQLLRRFSICLGRETTEDERREMRRRFAEAVRASTGGNRT